MALLDTPMALASVDRRQRNAFLLFCSFQLKHLRTYAEDVLLLDQGSRTGLPQALPEGGAGAGREALLLAIATEASDKEVNFLRVDSNSPLEPVVREKRREG